MSINYHDGKKWNDAYPRPPLRRPDGSSGCYDLYAIGKRIASGAYTRIVLMGDSITDGAGGSGYNGSHSGGFSDNTDGYCWANVFKKHIEEKIGVAVKNAGMSGTLAAWQVERMIGHLDGGELVIWLSGTNNRAYADGFNDYNSNMGRYIRQIRSRCRDLLVMSCIPASASNEAAMYATSAEICGVLVREAVGVAYFLDLRREYIRHCETFGLSIESTLADGLHPNDTGYWIMFRLLCEGIGIPLSTIINYRQDGDWWNSNTVLLDTGAQNSGPLAAWNDTTLPLIQMAQYDEAAEATLFSGKTIRRIRLVGNGTAAGTATVGTQALADIDSGILNIGNRVTVSVDEAGMIDFGAAGFYVPEHHTLALFDPEDTCRASYSFTEVNAENYMYIPGQWAAAEKPAPAIKLCAVFYV